MSKGSCRTRIICLVVGAGAWMGASSSLWASGFQRMEQNVTYLGTAYAGTAALAENASTGFYNAAGLSRLSHEQIAFSLVGVQPYGYVVPSRALSTSGVEIRNEKTRLKGDFVTPGLHYAIPVCGGWTFGFNIASPFGLKTQYDVAGVARYMSTRSEITTYDIAPSVAYAFGNGLSVGGGIDFVYVNTKFDVRRGIGNPVTDGFVETTAAHWGVGGHVGLLLDVDDNTRVGLNYRSRVDVKARGEAIVLNPLVLGGTGVETRLDAHVRFRLPDTAVLSVFRQFDDRWAGVADIQWTHWKIFKDVSITHVNDATFTFPQNFRDSYRFAVGLTHQFNSTWKLRLGTAYDMSAVRDQFRTTRIPDSNRTWVALGAQYRIHKCLAMDVGYAHLFFKEAKIADVGIERNALTGHYKRGRVDMLGFQLTWDV